MTTHKKHLYYLDELSGYKISDGYPDVRNWQVKDIDDRVIGKVNNLMVNAETERVVYLDVEVDESIIDAKHDPYARSNNGEIHKFVNKDGENHIIVPIGLVDFNEDSDYVYTDVIDHRTFAETKRYRKGDTIERDYEVHVMDSYGRRTRSMYDKDESTYDRNYDSMPSEARIREIVRHEIHRYHESSNSMNGNNGLSYRNRYNGDDVEDAVIISDEELDRKRRNNDIYDDDRFYERREFDDSRFKKSN